MKTLAQHQAKKKSTKCCWGARAHKIFTFSFFHHHTLCADILKKSRRRRRWKKKRNSAHTVKMESKWARERWAMHLFLRIVCYKFWFLLWLFFCLLHTLCVNVCMVRIENAKIDILFTHTNISYKSEICL